MRADLRRLALGTALTSTLIVAGLMSVSPARAADECGPLAPTVTCTSTSGVGNPYPDGIEYSPPGDFTLIVDPTVVIDTTGSGMNGISIPDPGDALPNGDIVVDIAPGSSITADGSGVYVAIDTGSITIANDAEITAGDEALSAITNGDSVTSALTTAVVSTPPMAFTPTHMALAATRRSRIAVTSTPATWVF